MRLQQNTFFAETSSTISSLPPLFYTKLFVLSELNVLSFTAHLFGKHVHYIRAKILN